jgi:hypothetical protein
VGVENETVPLGPVVDVVVQYWKPDVSKPPFWMGSVGYGDGQVKVGAEDVELELVDVDEIIDEEDEEDEEGKTVSPLP